MIANKDMDRLTNINSIFRAIDLICLLIAPLIIGLQILGRNYILQELIPQFQLNQFSSVFWRPTKNVRSQLDCNAVYGKGKRLRDFIVLLKKVVQFGKKMKTLSFP